MYLIKFVTVLRPDHVNAKTLLWLASKIGRPTSIPWIKLTYQLQLCNTTPTNPTTPATMPAGRLPHAAIHKHFVYKSPSNRRKLLIAVCCLCGSHNQAKSTTREEKHLLESCTKYHEYQQTHNSKTQTKLPHHTKSISPKQKLQIDQKLVFAIFKTS